MAESHRSYIFGALIASLLGVFLIVFSVSSDSWIVSTTDQTTGDSAGVVKYGLFRGTLEMRLVGTPSINTLYMTCVPGINSCAVSCKTTTQARQEEVRALANRYQPSNLACNSVTSIDTTNLLDEPATIPFALYVSLVIVLFLQLAFAAISACLSFLNVCKNPTEPIFGLPGVLWSSCASAILGLLALLLMGCHWALSSLPTHLAFAYFAVGFLIPQSALGYSYWLLIPASLCSIASAGLVLARGRALERAPPPPAIKVDNHSDGTIFLY